MDSHHRLSAQSAPSASRKARPASITYFVDSKALQPLASSSGKVLAVCSAAAHGVAVETRSLDGWTPDGCRETWAAIGSELFKF